MRAIFQALGATVTWDEATKSATALRGTQSVTVTIDSNTAWVNHVYQYLDVPPLLHNGSTLVPVRFVSESFGATVTWDETARTIDIDLTD